MGAPGCAEPLGVSAGNFGGNRVKGLGFRGLVLWEVKWILEFYFRIVDVGFSCSAKSNSVGPGFQIESPSVKMCYIRSPKLGAQKSTVVRQSSSQKACEDQVPTKDHKVLYD